MWSHNNTKEVLPNYTQQSAICRSNDGYMQLGISIACCCRWAAGIILSSPSQLWWLLEQRDSHWYSAESGAGGGQLCQFIGCNQIDVRRCDVQMQGSAKGHLKVYVRHLYDYVALIQPNTEVFRTKYTPTYICCIYMQNSCCQHISIHICVRCSNRHIYILGHIKGITNMNFHFNNWQPILRHLYLVLYSSLHFTSVNSHLYYPCTRSVRCKPSVFSQHQFIAFFCLTDSHIS